MKLQALVFDDQSDVLIRDEGTRVFAQVGAREYELDVQESHDGFRFIHDARVFNCRVEGTADSGKTLDIVVGTHRYSVTIVDPKRLRSAASVSAHAGEAARVIAPMPGKVVRVLVEPGASVEAGAGLVVVEAMKMQNEMKSPKAGSVTSINVEVGGTVNAGDVLAVVE
jgi:biotin carboxyl carrier protein